MAKSYRDLLREARDQVREIMGEGDFIEAAVESSQNNAAWTAPKG